MPDGQTSENTYAAALELFATFNELLPAIRPVVKAYKSTYSTRPLGTTVEVS